MEIIIGKTSGFCQGIAYTVKMATQYIKEAKANNYKLYCLGDIIHNERLLESFKNNGMIFVKNLSEVFEGSKVIFKAHGERKENYTLAKEKNIEVIDLACGKVRAIRNKVELANKDSIIIIFGNANHPEVIGTYSFCEDGFVAEKVEDLMDIKNKIKEIPKNKIFIVEQTTYNEGYFDSIVDEIKNILSDYDITIAKTICNATHERQEETKRLSKEVDSMIIIGGKNSSNTKELYNIAKKECNDSFLIQEVDNLKEIDFDFSKCNKVGIMAGASTPEEVVNEVVEYLESIG